VLVDRAKNKMMSFVLQPSVVDGVVVFSPHLRRRRPPFSLHLFRRPRSMATLTAHREALKASVASLVALPTPASSSLIPNPFLRLSSEELAAESVTVEEAKGRLLRVLRAFVEALEPRYA
jgi:hypothetical protein